MIDLTPLDVRKKRGDFRRILRGYDPGEVDTFLEAVEHRMEALVMENLALTEKTHRLASQLEALEGREKAVQEALVTAQKLREDVQDQSKREATSLREQVKRETESLRGEAHREASILRDEAIREAASVRDQARRESELLRREVLGEIEARILEADGLLKERQRALEDIERSRGKFLKGFKSLLEREMDAVEVEEARRPLEDTPLELNLKGWPRERDEGGGAGEEGEEGEEGGEGAEPDETQEEEALPDASSHPEPYEPVFDLEGQGGGSLEEDPALGWGAMPGDEPPQGEFSDIVPLGVFDAPSGDQTPFAAVDGTEEGPDDPTANPEPSPEPENVDAESEPLPDRENPDAALGLAVNLLLDRHAGGGGASDPEPLWLSTLLEQAGNGEGTGGAGGGGGPSVGELEPSPGDGEGEQEGEDEDEPRID
jgi:DivIVA domain-containing protein